MEKVLDVIPLIMFYYVRCHLSRLKERTPLLAVRK